MKRIMRTSICIALLVAAVSCRNSDIDYRLYYNRALEEISSEQNYGRSLYNDGDIKAARVIIDHALNIEGLVPMGENARIAKVPARPEYKSVVNPGGLARWDAQSENMRYIPYLQNFQFDMNVMRGDMAVSIDGKPLRATWDFTAKEFSPSCHGTFKIREVPDDKVTSEGFVDYLNSGEFKDCFAIVNWQRYLTLDAHHFERYLPYIGKLDPDKISGIIMRDSELFPYFKARSYYNSPIPVLMMTDDAIADGSKEISVDIDAEMISQRDAHNIIAYLPGTDMDSHERITFIAHYDHLGLMGRDNLYPGANDNASGAAMLLTLAEYFSVNRPSLGLDFIWLDAEEENLLGAFYYCANPTMPLDEIRFLINLDMIADDGDHLVAECTQNGADHFAVIESINSDNSGYPPFEITLQDLSDNSDHYAFAEAGVPCIYFETEGSLYEHYHTPRDSYGNSTDVNFDRLFSLLVKYVESQQ